MAKSDPTQYLWKEVMVADDVLQSYHREDGLWGEGSPTADRVADILEELALLLRHHVRHGLTTRQCEVVERVYFQGLTQQATALQLGLCQPTVHKTLFGNVLYDNGKVHHGGAIRKLRKVCTEDPVFQSLLSELGRLRSGQE